MAIVIPAGKRVTIYRAEQVLLPDLLLEEDVTVDLSSTFDQLIDSSASAAGSVLGNLLGDLTGTGGSGTFKQFGLQIWKGTQPLSLSFVVGLYMKTDAFNDVMAPAKTLMKLPLPGPGSGALGLEPPGPSILEAFTEGGTNSQLEGKRLSLRIGNIIYLKRLLVKAAQPTFSRETDENGYPIWVKVKVDAVSIYTATTDLIEEDIGV